MFDAPSLVRVRGFRVLQCSAILLTLAACTGSSPAPIALFKETHFPGRYEGPAIDPDCPEQLFQIDFAANGTARSYRLGCGDIGCDYPGTPSDPPVTEVRWHWRLSGDTLFLSSVESYHCNRLVFTEGYHNFALLLHGPVPALKVRNPKGKGGYFVLTKAAAAVAETQ